MASLSKEEKSCFAGEIIDDFNCVLCLNVLKNPLQCQRNEHHFCRTCITRHLKKSKTCPSCKEELSLETIRPASRIITKLLSQLVINCDYSKRGCRKVIKVEDLESHLKECGFAPVVCNNEGCGMTLNRSGLMSHESQSCEHRMVECSVCDDSVVYRRLQSHGCVLRMELNEVKSSLEEIRVSLGQILRLVKPLDESVFRSVKQDIFTVYANYSQPTNPLIWRIYDWKTRAWLTRTQTTDFSFQYATSFIHQNTLFITGVSVQDGKGKFIRSDRMKTITLGQKFFESEWKDGLPSLPYACYGHATVLVKDRLLVFGGRDSQDAFLDGVHEVLLVSPYSSKLLSRMPEPRYRHSAELIGDKVVIMGGETSSGSSNEVLVYDLTKNKWTKLAPLSSAASGMATACWKDNVIMFSGQQASGNSCDVNMYNITSQKCVRLPSMSKNQKSCVAVAINGNIFVMGSNTSNHSHVECFSLDLKCWLEPVAFNIPPAIYSIIAEANTGKF